MLNQDDEFVSICDFARHYYRDHKWQIMPLSPNTKIPPKDFPAIQLQKGLLDESAFDAMWGKNGRFVRNYNCGVLCGSPSSGLFVIDLDTQKSGSKALGWWQDIHAMRPTPETPTQITGSGGMQVFFRMPDGMKAFNHKCHSLNVDFQGEGAYVVLPPSIHPNGNRYRWVDGMSPDECDTMILPQYLIDEITAIIGSTGSGLSGDRAKTSTPEYKVTPLGAVVDGREDLMTRVVFRAVLELYRKDPAEPDEDRQAWAKEIAFTAYLETVESRLGEPAVAKEAALEKEGRGRTLFEKKWLAAMRQWDDKVRKEAARPFVKEPPESVNPFADPPPEPGSKEPPNEPPEDPPDEGSKEPPDEDPDFETKKKKLLKLYTMSEVRALGPVKALIQDTVAESSLGFIYGAPGCGKTFVALSMGLSIAYGLPHWFWGKKIERSGPVIYISLEGKSDLSNRLEAWKKHHKLDHDEDRFRIVMDEVNFLDNESIKMFVDSIDDYVSGHEKPVMIFIDTLSRAIAGGNENDQQEVSKFIQTCDRIKTRYSSNVTGIHHLGRSGEHMRGSTTLDGGADYMYRVTRDKENGLNGVIFAAKIKAYADKWELPFRLAKVELDDFGVQSSLVAMTDAEPPKATNQPPEEDFGGKQEFAKEPDMDTCKKMVEAIDEAWRGGYPWSRASGKDSDRIASERLADRFNFSVEVCQKYVNMWHRNDVIVTDTWGDRKQKKGLRRGKGL